MKKIIFTAITILSLASVKAQFEKGSKWIAGAARITVAVDESNETPLANSTNYNNFSVGFRPSVNTFISDKVMNTVFIGYTYGSSKSDYLDAAGVSFNTSKGQSHSLQLGFGKTHLHPLLGKVYSAITTHFYGEYTFSKSDAMANSSSIINTVRKTNNYSVGANVSLGLIYRASDRFAITTTLNNFLYGAISSNNQKNNSTGTAKTSTKGFSINGGFGLSGFNLSSLQFGLMYRLKSKS